MILPETQQRPVAWGAVAGRAHWSPLGTGDPELSNKRLEISTRGAGVSASVSNDSRCLTTTAPLILPPHRVRCEVLTQAPPRSANCRGHGNGSEVPMHEQSTEVGLCQCGCGQRTAIAAYTSRRRGWIKGQSRAYVKGHNQLGRIVRDDYQVVNAGYPTPCWEWAKSRNDRGYGFALRQGARRAAHVIYYEKYVGLIPAGMEIDHLCRNRACVNPEHLEAVTHKENMVRGIIATHVPGRSALRDVRVTARMSQDDVAALLGVKQATVSEWERGIRPVPTDVLERLQAGGG